VFGNGPVACWATLLPKAKSVEDKGGFRVSGNFAWGSSSSLSRWVLVAEPLDERDGRQWFRAHLLPKEDVEIKEGSWDVMGLRATASIDYVISDRFVPAHRTFEYPFLSDGNPQHASALGLVELGRPGMAAFTSGIGLGALAELVAAAPKTKRLRWPRTAPRVRRCSIGASRASAKRNGPSECTVTAHRPRKRNGLDGLSASIPRSCLIGAGAEHASHPSTQMRSAHQEIDEPIGRLRAPVDQELV
jgi:hypothetical protein